MSSNTIINQNIELVQTMCSNSAIEFTGLLAALQSRYPATGWTETLLTTRLTNGVKAGLFIKVGTNIYTGVVEGYGLNKKALKLNSANAIYGPYCPSVFGSTSGAIPCGCGSR